jgi:hypothetical protein
MTSILALALLAPLLSALCMEALAILRARAPLRPSSICIGPPPDTSATLPEIPRIVWTYWDHLPPPELVARCLQLWRNLAPDHEIRLVDRSTASRWLGTDVDATTFDALPAYRQADWLRLQLLIRHGGIWMDGSTLLTEGLDWVHRLRAETGAGVVGFYIDRYTTDRRHPIIENWFLAASARDPYLVAWAGELDRALSLGEAGYLDALRRDGRLEAAAQAIPEGMRSYLIMHVAAVVALQRAPDASRLVLQRAEDVAFAFHAALRWRKRHVYARLALTPAPRRPPALIKLRSGDRAVMEKGLARGWIWRRSLLARLLGAAA